MRPSASHFLKLISTECTDPPRAEMTMKSMMKQLLRRNRSILTRNFLEKLMRKGVGTNKAKNYARSLAKNCCSSRQGGRERTRKSLLQKIMKQKKDDATETVKVEDSKYHQTMKELKINITGRKCEEMRRNKQK